MTVDDLRARVRRLEDERAIVSRVLAYAHGITSRRVEQWLDCFTEDAVLAHRPTEADEWRFHMQGHAELAPWYEDHVRRWPYGSIVNVTLSPRLVSVGDERAETLSHWLLLRRETAKFELATTGTYADVLVRCDDGDWRIRQRHVTGLPEPGASAALV